MESPHLPMIKALAKQKAPVIRLEHGHPFRNTHEALGPAVIYDVFCDDSVVLVLTHIDKAVESPAPMMQGQTQKPKTTRTRTYLFHWVPIASIIDVRHDSGVSVDIAKRKILREDIPPIYTDHMPGWETMNAGVHYHVERTLYTMGLREKPPEKPGNPKPAGGAPQITMTPPAAAVPSVVPVAATPSASPAPEVPVSPEQKDASPHPSPSSAPEPPQFSTPPVVQPEIPATAPATQTDVPVTAPAVQPETPVTPVIVSESIVAPTE